MESRPVTLGHLAFALLIGLSIGLGALAGHLWG